MNHNVIKFCCLLTISAPLSFTNAHAVLIDNDDGTITDTETNLMWLKDLNLTDTLGVDDVLNGGDTNGALQWQDAIDWANALVFANFDDWRLPTADATCYDPNAFLTFNCTDSELGELYYESLGNTAGSLSNPGPFINGPISPQFWTSTEFNDELAFDFHFNNGGQHPWQKAGNRSLTNVIAVREINSVPVPEPTTLLLISGGLVGFSVLYGNKKG